MTETSEFQPVNGSVPPLLSFNIFPLVLLVLRLPNFHHRIHRKSSLDEKEGENISRSMELRRIYENSLFSLWLQRIDSVFTNGKVSSLTTVAAYKRSITVDKSKRVNETVVHRTPSFTPIPTPASFPRLPKTNEI